MPEPGCPNSPSLCEGPVVSLVAGSCDFYEQRFLAFEWIAEPAQGDLMSPGYSQHAYLSGRADKPVSSVA